MSLALREVTDSFIGFTKTSHRLMHIENERDYQDALELIEHLMLTLDDTGEDPLVDLLNIVSHAIEIYESQQPDVNQFLLEYNEMDKAVAILKILMRQYELGVADFKEQIGTKSYVSMILNGDRQLSKKHIEKLCERFGLSPALFF